MEKLAKFFSNAKTIWGSILVFWIAGYNVITWAGDARYVTIVSYEVSQIKAEIRRLNSKIAAYQTQLLYEQSAQKKAMLRALIINVETEIKNLKGE